MYHLFHMQHYNKYYLKDIDFNKVIIKYNSKDYIYTYDLPITNMSNNFMIAYINKQDIYTFRLLESFRNYEIVYHPLTLKQKLDVL